MNLMQGVMRTLMGRRLPVVSGDLKVEGVRERIEIGRDGNGIPYIEANNTLDAWFGLGFCQGQDRSFQLEMLLRLSRGTVSEIVGENGLPLDRLSRRLGFFRAASAQAASLSLEDQDMLSAFADGISAGATAGCPKPAHEFGLLRCRPTAWDGVDVMAGLNFISLALSAWTGKVTRLMMTLLDGAEAVRALDDACQEWLPVTKPVGAKSGAALDRLAEDLTLLSAVLGNGGASNNWALSPTRTKSGRPILANDPHLAPTIPAPWYLASVRTPEWSVAGASFVGAPLIPAGHNGVAAWGVTAGLADNIDLYLEDLSEDGRSVREGDQWLPCDVLREVIKVKGRPDHIEEIMVTKRGPIISPILEGVDKALSFKAIWMIPGQLKALTRYHGAKEFEAFRQGVTSASAGSLNMVYADVDGNIGWQMAGNLPRRTGGHCIVPLPGWDERHSWLPEPYGIEELPYMLNAEAGFIATANNKPTADGDGPYLGVDFVEGYRQARIVERLAERHDWDLAGCMDLQTEQITLAWREMKEVVLSALEEGEVDLTGLRLLQAWDGSVGADSAAAAAYEHFLSEIATRIAVVKAPKSSAWAMGKGFHPLFPGSVFALRRISQIVRLLNEQPEGWLPNPWPQEIREGFDRAMKRLSRQRGPDQENWRWGNVRPLTLLHALASQKPLDKIFNLGPFPWGGDGQTVAQASLKLTDLGANPTTIANMRMVLDVGEWDNSRFVLAGGQSGNPFSPHYQDLLPLWKRGEGVPIAWSPEEVERSVVNRLRLRPVS